MLIVEGVGLTGREEAYYGGVRFTGRGEAYCRGGEAYWTRGKAAWMGICLLRTG